MKRHWYLQLNFGCIGKFFAKFNLMNKIRKIGAKKGFPQQVKTLKMMLNYSIYKSFYNYIGILLNWYLNCISSSLKIKLTYKILKFN